MAHPEAPTSDTSSNTRPHFWGVIPISLRAFMALTVILGVGSMLWVGVPAYRQHMAVREIERVGGWVGTLPRGPKMLRAWVGSEWMKSLDAVDVVYLGNSRVTDSTLLYVAWFERLRVLELSDTQVGDAGVAHLVGLVNLERLDLSHTRLTDAGLLHVKRMAGLKDLAVAHTHVTDAGLVHLKELLNLEYVSAH